MQQSHTDSEINIIRLLLRYRIKTLLFKEDDNTKFRVYYNQNGSITFIGQEITILETFAKKLHGGIQFSLAKDHIKPGERNPWRQTNDIKMNMSAIKIRLISDRDLDLLNTDDMLLKNDLQGVSECLYPHAQDDFMVIMGKKGEIPKYKYLFMVFRIEVWGVLVVLLGIGTLVWYKMDRRIFKTKSETFINIIRMITGGALPANLWNLPEKIFLSFFLLCNLILLTAFTSILTSELTDVKYQSQVNTLDELIEGDYKIHGWQTQLEELTKAFSGTSRSVLIPKLRQMPPKYDPLDSTKNNWTEALFNFIFKNPTILNYERASKVIITRIFYGHFHVVKESPFPNYIAFQMPARSPFYDEFNIYLRQVIESGLVKYWKDMYVYRLVLQGMYVGPEKPTRKLSKISLDHLTSAFLILFFGSSLGFLVFIYEVLYFKIKNRNIT